MARKQKLRTILARGFLKENPLLKLLLGTCPALAVTTSMQNGLGMGMAATFVLLLSNLVISLLRKVIPDKVRIPAYITIIASFVTILQFLLEAYSQELNQSLGIFIPLITVNCIILGRAEAFAGKNSPLASVVDGLGMGIGFTSALFLIGTIREVLGNGTFFNLAIPFIGEGHTLQPMLIFILPPGGFFAFGILIALAQKLGDKVYKSLPAEAFADEAPQAFDPDCLACGGIKTSEEALENKFKSLKTSQIKIKKEAEKEMNNERYFNYSR